MIPKRIQPKRTLKRKTLKRNNCMKVKEQLISALLTILFAIEA